MDMFPQSDSHPTSRGPRLFGFVAASLVVVTGVAIYFFLTRSTSRVPAISTETSSPRNEAVADTAPSVAPTPVSAGSSTSQSTLLPVALQGTLQELVASNPDEKARYERHMRLLTVQMDLDRVANGYMVAKGSTPSEAASVFLTAFETLTSDLQTNAELAAKLRAEAEYRLKQLADKKQRVADSVSSVSYSEIDELRAIMRLVKQDSDSYYRSLIIEAVERDIARPTLTLEVRIFRASSFLVMNDAEISWFVAEFLRAVATGDLGSDPVISAADKARANELLSQIQAKEIEQ